MNLFFLDVEVSVNHVPLWQLRNVLTLFDCEDLFHHVAYVHFALFLQQSHTHRRLEFDLRRCRPMLRLVTFLQLRQTDQLLELVDFVERDQSLGKCVLTVFPLIRVHQLFISSSGVHEIEFEDNVVTSLVWFDQRNRPWLAWFIYGKGIG